jgi:molybdate transport system permease protein
VTLPGTRRAGIFPVAAAAGLAGLGLLLVLPFAGLLAKVDPGAMVARLGDPIVLEALRLSLVTSLAATAMVVGLGLPAAYVLATRRFPGKRVLEVLVQLPMVLPPTVAGFALLLAFGRVGLAGRALESLGISLPFTTLGAVLAQAFMSAPFFVSAARAGFEGVDRRLLEAAATLRAGESHRFLRVMLPLAMPALLAGVAMSGARALGEFGATITFAGNLPGVTQTMPLAVYVALQSDLDAAVVMSTILLLMSFLLLLGLRWAPAGWMGLRPDARDRSASPAG